MKKIVNSILALACVAFAATSCALDKTPETGLMEEKSFTFEYEQGLRAGIYNAMKGALSGSTVTDPDLYTDQLSLTYGSTDGNNNYSVFTWHLYPTTGEVSSMWTGVYARMSMINYAIWHMNEGLKRNETTGVMTSAQVEKVRGYIGEMYFFRAWTMYRGARIFCAQPGLTEADRSKQAGLPYPLEVNPDAQLSRKSMTDLLTQINADLAEAAKSVKGSAYAPVAQSMWLTTDCLTAFHAQLALWLRDYAAADTYATDLINSSTYTLATQASDIEKAWRQDDSNETILQLETLRTTSGTTGSFSTYINSSLDPDGTDVLRCAPYFVPDKRIVTLFVDTNSNGVNEPEEFRSPLDWRVGIFITRPYGPTTSRPSPPVSADKKLGLSGNPYVVRFSDTHLSSDVVMVNKFLGNKNFQVNTKSFIYRSAPKMFRVAEMYLIAAEARLQNGGDALTPLNDLRKARGLGELSGTEDLMQEIKNERNRELLGEGERLFDLKRWDEGFTRTMQSSSVSTAEGIWFNTGSPNASAKPSTDNRYVWPIPLSEISNNPKLNDETPAGSTAAGGQNLGY